MLSNKEKEFYEALKESDKLTGKNEAESYYNSKIKTNKNSPGEKEKELNSDEPKYNPSILIIHLLVNLILFVTSFDFLGAIGIIMIIVYNSILWLSCFISILINEFKKDINKLIWILLIIFLPISILFYFDFAVIQTKKKQKDFKINN
ncbi:MAG: hypothetical protein ACQERD_00910 [Campylobacterota bacterium]